jgi:hypothetical protein
MKTSSRGPALAERTNAIRPFLPAKDAPGGVVGAGNGDEETGEQGEQGEPLGHGAHLP